MKKIIIAEKPDLAMKIVKAISNTKKNDGYFENDQYIITFAFGHLLTLKSIDQYMNREKAKWSLDEIPFIPEHFEYILKEDPGVRKQYNTIKTLYVREDITGIINAGDPDREGSVIILNIVNQLSKETGKQIPVERIWLKATTADYIKSALKDLHSEEYYGNYYEEGLARTYSDWLYGINFTRYVTLKCNTFLPVGRVLIPIVKFIYDRNNEINNFQEERYYEIEGIIIKDGIEVKCKIEECRFKEDEREKGERVLSHLKESSAYVNKVESNQVKKRPPKLFSLDKLQNKMAKDEKISSAETLSIVQKLYEAGYVTYPRTNTEYMITDEIPMVEALVNNLAEENSLRMRTDKAIFDDTKTEGHTALIITSKIPELDKLSERERLIYEVIKNRFISNFLNEDTVVEETQIEITMDQNKIILKGNVIKSKGFYKYEKPDKENYLPTFNEGEKVNIQNLKLVLKKTSPPKNVTEPELNEFLKNPYKKNEISEVIDDEEYKQMLRGCEIGTVATRAAIIENTIKYEYIKKEKTLLLITKKGVGLIESLQQLGISMDKEKTVELGILLKKVFLKEYSKDSLVHLVADEVIEVTKDKYKKVENKNFEKEGIGKCPLCGGIVMEGKENYYCNKYKEGCQFRIWKVISEKKLSEVQVKKLLKGEKTGIIKGFMSKAGKKFDAKLKIKEDGRIEFVFEK